MSKITIFVVISVCFMLIGLTVPITSTINLEYKKTLEKGYLEGFEPLNGSLSGYVTDTYMNPIEGARVSVHFHGTFEENYTDSTGYYHVKNIPICYCYKNATASKAGYTTEWILLGIVENTTHNFTLTPLGIRKIITLTSGWNFISLPFNQSVDKTDFIINNNGNFYFWSQATISMINQYIFSWERTTQSYEFTDLLKPGFGYWIYAYESCEIWLENMTLPPDNIFITVVEPGWNIIGIPNNEDVSKSEILVNDNSWSSAVTAGWISDFIFNWDRYGQYYNLTDTLTTSFAYWIFAYQTCILKRTI